MSLRRDFNNTNIHTELAINAEAIKLLSKRGDGRIYINLCIGYQDSMNAKEFARLVTKLKTFPKPFTFIFYPKGHQEWKTFLSESKENLNSVTYELVNDWRENHQYQWRLALKRHYAYYASSIQKQQNLARLLQQDADKFQEQQKKRSGEVAGYQSLYISHEHCKVHTLVETVDILSEMESKNSYDVLFMDSFQSIDDIFNLPGVSERAFVFTNNNELFFLDKSKGTSYKVEVEAEGGCAALKTTCREFLGKQKPIKAKVFVSDQAMRDLWIKSKKSLLEKFPMAKWALHFPHEAMLNKCVEFAKVNDHQPSFLQKFREGTAKLIAEIQATIDIFYPANDAATILADLNASLLKLKSEPKNRIQIELISDLTDEQLEPIEQAGINNHLNNLHGKQQNILLCQYEIYKTPKHALKNCESMGFEQKSLQECHFHNVEKSYSLKVAGNENVSNDDMKNVSFKEPVQESVSSVKVQSISPPRLHSIIKSPAVFDSTDESFDDDREPYIKMTSERILAHFSSYVTIAYKKFKSAAMIFLMEHDGFMDLICDQVEKLSNDPRATREILTAILEDAIERWATAKKWKKVASEKEKTILDWTTSNTKNNQKLIDAISKINFQPQNPSINTVFKQIKKFDDGSKTTREKITAVLRKNRLTANPEYKEAIKNWIDGNEKNDEKYLAILDSDRVDSLLFNEQIFNLTFESVIQGIEGRRRASANNKNTRYSSSLTEEVGQLKDEKSNSAGSSSQSSSSRRNSSLSSSLTLTDALGSNSSSSPGTPNKFSSTAAITGIFTANNQSSSGGRPASSTTSNNMSPPTRSSALPLPTTEISLNGGISQTLHGNSNPVSTQRDPQKTPHNLSRPRTMSI